MNNRQRFKSIMNFKSVDRFINNELGLWEQTVDRWTAEGVPEGKIKSTNILEFDSFFGLDLHQSLNIKVLQPYPFRGNETISEDERTRIFIDEFGIKRRELKEGSLRGQRMSMDQFLEFPVKDRATFTSWKKRFENPYLLRYPDDFKEKTKLLAERDYPLFLPGIGTFGFYAMLRYWFGTEGLSYILYDDPLLVEEMLDFQTEYITGLLDEALKTVDFDWYLYWEDMSCKTGSLMSPDMVKKLFVPRYKKINEKLKSHGIDIIFVDSDGDISKLIPLFIESGINGVLPLEVASGMDAVKLRKEYGRDLLMIGGIDKRQLAKDKKAIEDEVKKVIEPIISEGGFIPTVDHAVPPDVPLENFLYYLKIKNKALGIK